MKPTRRDFVENRDALIDLHVEALAWLEAYTAIPYPFGKFDFVLIPSFQFSGMEHPGAIYYNASSVMLDRTATHAQQLARANVIAHEVAHLWFGDLVTMKWFDDVWTKEVFAGFLADKVVNPMFPAVDHDLRFLWQHYPGAYDVDRTAAPIRSGSPSRTFARPAVCTDRSSTRRRRSSCASWRIASARQGFEMDFASTWPPTRWATRTGRT